MCIFTNDKDIPPYVRISTRTLQYFVIPLLSIAIITVGSRHLEDCPGQPNLPIWHIVAGCSGLLVPVLYILFDMLNPRIASNWPLLSEILDNAVVFIIPVYVLFEVIWLITGTVWIVSASNVECDPRIYAFSTVVIINFWIHLLTPVIFITSVCFSRIFPFLGYCTYWNIIKNAVDMWTFRTRVLLSIICSLPLSCAMITVGVNGLFVCKPQGVNNVIPTAFGGSSNINTTITTTAFNNSSDNTTVEDGTGHHYHSWLNLGYMSVPCWLIVAGALLLVLPIVYTIYDKATKTEENVTSGCWDLSISVAIFYLLCGLVWAILGFIWIFGTQNEGICDHDSSIYKFAFASLIILNVLMDMWICIKICIVLYWSVLTED